MIIQSDYLVKRPKLSLVIATYNQVKYIEQTVESALAQVCSFDYEILVADDGSNDGNRELLKQLQKKYPDRIKLIFNDKNMMVTRNYVNAILEARGEFVATLDGDDYYVHNNVLQLFYDYLISNRQISLVHAGYQSFDNETGKITGVYTSWSSPITEEYGRKGVFEYLSNNLSFYPLGSSSCFRREFYIEGCKNYQDIIKASEFIGEGTILNVSMLMKGPFGFIPEIVTNYRVLRSSLCHFDDDLIKEFAFWHESTILVLKAGISVNLDDNQMSVIFNKRYSYTFRLAVGHNLREQLYKAVSDYRAEFGNTRWFKPLDIKLSLCIFSFRALRLCYLLNHKDRN